MDIEESEQEMKQERSLLDPMVELFEQIEEGHPRAAFIY